MGYILVWKKGRQSEIARTRHGAFAIGTKREAIHARKLALRGVPANRRKGIKLFIKKI